MSTPAPPSQQPATDESEGRPEAVTGIGGLWESEDVQRPATPPPPPSAPPADPYEKPAEEPARPEPVGGSSPPAPVGGSSRPAPSGDPARPVPIGSVDDALVRLGAVTPEQLERARRIRDRMESPRPLGEVLVELGMATQEVLDRARRARLAQMTLLDILRENDAITPEAAHTYRTAKARVPSPPDRELLLGANLVSEEAYLRAVGIKLDIPFVEPHIGEVDTALLATVPLAYLKNNCILPVREEQEGILTVIVAHPEDETRIIEVERTFGMRAKRLCSTAGKITTALQTLERLQGKSAGDALSIQYRRLDHSIDKGEETGEEAIQLVDYLLTRAVQLGASDLHIEPTQHQIRVRVRIDGVLHHLTDLPVDFTARLVARIKILASVDVTEKRKHQDGKIHVKVDGREVDIRVSTYVSTFGETIVMRILERDRSIVPVEALGFQPRVYASLTDVALKASSGLVLLVGPTGSGKTTTLYSFIGHANDPSRKVITCEDPVEYVIDGIIQCSINERAGRSFPDSLRAIVRQDPDTIVVGEIRDKVTASLAVESALTGHKVFSTFHTEEAVGAFVRLLEMGVEPFLVASTISAVIAQRLIRRLCPKCKATKRPSRGELKFLNVERSDLAGHLFYRPTGCEACAHTGYKGRLPVHEVLIPGDELRGAVLAQASSGKLRAGARNLPEFLTMQEDGLLKALGGVTSLSEIIENVPRDPDARPVSTLMRVANSKRSR